MPAFNTPPFTPNHTSRVQCMPCVQANMEAIAGIFLCVVPIIQSYMSKWYTTSKSPKYAQQNCKIGRQTCKKPYNWTPEHLLRYTQHTRNAIMLRPDCLPATERARWFDFFDEKMRLPPSEDPVRPYVLVNRRSCRLTNAWLHAYESIGRCHTLTNMRHMPFKHMHADGTQTWVRDQGPWDLCLIEHRKIQWHDLNTHEIARTLRQLTHRTCYPGARQHIPEAFQCYPSHVKTTVVSRVSGKSGTDWLMLAICSSKNGGLTGPQLTATSRRRTTCW